MSICSRIVFFNKKSLQFLSFTSLKKSLVKYSRKKTHKCEHSSVCVVSNRSQMASVKSPSEIWSYRLRGIRASWPLVGAGLAALLSIELVVANAMLGNQVTPAKMVHAVVICRDNKKYGTGLAAVQKDCFLMMTVLPRNTQKNIKSRCPNVYKLVVLSNRKP